ncbi:putative transcription elongation factor spt6 [Coleophoma crateriformis]|uniref:Transcription elongation factor Spt6 n=1 Tax=Coleophoma crateriformis TaxID=565419 RepID=A0A3D8SYE5_9HELO|nr:putative transcription elongation factor spt6 [Coleophoma crateriformis]
MSMRDLIQGEAELDDEENDDSFDEDTGEVRPTKKSQNGNGHLDDSSEEEDDDDDEEAAREVREGFIIDDDDDEEPDERERRRRRDKKRRRAEREEEEAALDEDDLDLIGETRPDWERKSAAQPKLKRLKRGHREEEDRVRERGLDEIFSDDEEVDGPGDAAERRFARPDHQRVDEFADFIEEDDLEDEDERQRHQEEMEVARPRERGYIGNGDTTGLDKDALDDMEAIFGNGEDYDWALALEDEAEGREQGDHALELKDVFEPSQLAERLLTDEDNQIRWADEPERFQLDRKPYKHVQITDEQFKEEARWITSLIWPKKQLDGDLQGPFTKAIGKVLEFFVVDEVEVPYVFQHRKDYLIHATKTRAQPDPNNPDAPEFNVSAKKLLNQDDLWRILELDLKFRALIDKRNVLEKTYDNLRASGIDEDKMFEAMLPAAVTMEELQDLQDYLYFQYAAQIKDLAAVNGDGKDLKRRPGGKSSLFDRVRRGRAYNFVRAYGITADQVAQNALREARKQYTEDHPERPIDFADSLTSNDDFQTGDAVLQAARATFAEELFMSPRMRKHFRMNYYMMGVVNCKRTEKGLRKIDEHHQYYEIKYLKNQTFGDLANKPEMFLKMLKAEEEGLLEVKVVLENERKFKERLYFEFASDNQSELADAWNDERQKVLDIAFGKLERVITKGVKESMRTECQDSILKLCREEYSKKLDQAPYKPKGMVLGTIPRVLALSNGNGDPGRDAVCWAWVEEDGRVLEHGKFDNLSRDNNARDAFVELVQRRKPDVLGVGGFSVETHKLISHLKDLVKDRELRGAEYEDQETGEDRSEPLDVVVVNDEVARLYKDSPRAALDHPALVPLTRYCVALAKYLQNPMKEYAALGKDVISLSFHPSQQLLPEDKLRRQLDTAMVDMVNLCGVDINEAIGDSYTANLLPYVCGLGPRKATSVIKAINANGGLVNTRDELVGDPDSGKLPVVGPRVWNNCASFLSIEYDSSTPTSDYLDNTRVHPEDYELGRKMAADALELDEEDVKAEVDEAGPGAIVRRLIKDDEQEKVNDLILEEYAEQLERNYNQRKRATLETIRAELQQPYEELRRSFALLSDEEIFTMLTGETSDSLCEGMIVSVNIRVVKEDFLIARLDSGIEGRVEATDGSDRGTELLNRLFSVGQTAQAKLLEMDRRNFTARLSLREEMLRIPYRKRVDREPGSWDALQEQQDSEELKEKDKTTGRTQRVVKHPLFRPFNSIQAEEYLGSQSIGDAVIRPSSKGNDHLAVTWKVADGVYQHLDVLELQKESEFSVGRQLRIGGKYTYTDLDELIVDHVKAMAKKVDEMMQHDKYQAGSKADTENWLTTYTEANTKRSVYAFCLDPKHPGYFNLCFKAGKLARVNTWPVRVVPNAFELMKAPYPDMKALCNGFKLRHASEMTRRG